MQYVESNLQTTCHSTILPVVVYIDWRRKQKTIKSQLKRLRNTFAEFAVRLIMAILFIFIFFFYFCPPLCFLLGYASFVPTPARDQDNQTSIGNLSVPVACFCQQHTHTHTEINRPCHPPLFLVDDGRINTRDGFAALDDPFKYFFFPLLSCDGRRRQSIPMTARKLWFIFRLTWFRSSFFLYFPIPAYLGSTFAPHRLLLFVAATRRAQLSDVIRYNQVKIKMAVADQLGMYEVVKKKSSPPQLWPRHFLFQFNLANKSFPVNVNNQARETLWLF